jgi:hypothetical protein
MNNSSKLLVESLVIQNYLQGKSMDKISKETGISKGKVHYLINDWQDKIGRPDVEELRQFVVLVKKSGMNIGQCAQGYRMVQLMKNLGIEDDNNQEFSLGNESGKKKRFFIFCRRNIS